MPRYKMTQIVPMWVRESIYVIADNVDTAKDALHQGHIDEYGDVEVMDKIRHIDSRDLTAEKLAERLTPAKAMQEIIRVRDYCAEHGKYPEGTVSYPEQRFDDWAADLCKETSVELEFCKRCDTDLDRDGYCKDFSCSHSGYLQHEMGTEG